jgi:hypothetical protein
MASEVTELPGHERRTYEELGVRLFEPAPKGFDPLTATAEELLRHGYSARPDADLHPDLYLRWKRLMSQITSIIVPEFASVPVVSAVASGQGSPKPFPTNGTSSDWAGVAVFPDFFDRINSVFGSWTVPNMQPVPSEARPFICASWIGIDGFSAGNNPVPASLVQVGTTRLLTSGITEVSVTYPWFEWVPNGPSTITNLAVHPGDVMTCEIILMSSTEASIHLTNVTSGLSAAFMQAAPGQIEAAGICAEWIVELPSGSINGHPLHLGRYGSVFFSGCFAHTRAGVNVNAGSGELLSMVNSFNSPLSTPTKLCDTALMVDFNSGGSGA